MTKFECSYTATTPALTYASGAGSYVGVTSGTPAAAIDGLRFMMGAGNITSGTFSLYGIKKS